MLVEDAQYADAGLLDFLDHLIDWSGDLPIYVLVFARPELGQARPGFGSGRNRSTLTLDPLDAASMDRLADALVPGMPTAARSKITTLAQGIPLFAVETIRALIDRDIVQPVEGVYRLTGDIGELAVPDSLHALLAARLDALDSDTRRLVGDAAVLGTTFPAEALIAVSRRDEAEVRAALAELVRREVLSVSADRLSPERGSYRFAQNMLRQVAYDTLSRRDRKTRHLEVAAHLRTAFASDGEEVAEVIARHYLDALNAIPGDPDTAGIRGQAIAALIRAGERAERTGAPARAAASYATSAELSSPDTTAAPTISDEEGREPAAGALWERAAQAAVDSGDYVAAAGYAVRARSAHAGHGQHRAAARAQVIAGRALRERGRLTEAREQLTAAAEVLRAEPDADTVRALEELAVLEVFAGSPDADRLSTEALTLGQALDVGASRLSGLLITRGIFLMYADRRTEAVAFYREAARLATEAGDNFLLGTAQLDLSAALTDPAPKAEAARAAAAQFGRVGNVDFLAYAIGNLAGSLMELGDWDAAQEELDQAIASGELAGHENIALVRAELAAERGDAATAETILAGLHDRRASEEVSHKAGIVDLEALIATVRGQFEEALRLARSELAYADVIGIGNVGGWELAVRAAFELSDTAAVRELLALLDSHQPGHIPPDLRAERDLARARLAGHDGDPAAGAAFTVAIGSLRELAWPHDLAKGLLDHAEYLMHAGNPEAAAAAINEARETARRLRCQPLLDRAEAIEHMEQQIRA